MDAVRKGISERRSPRRVFSRSIGILCRGRYKLVQALEISEGGIRFASETRFAGNEKVMFTIVIPGGSSIIVRGEILRENEGANGSYLYGCQFHELELHQRRSVRAYISSKTEEEAEIESDDGY